MKFYSEELKKFFDTQNDCVEAEEKHKKEVVEIETKKKALAEKRAERAKEVERYYEVAIAAKKNYDKALKEFLKDYGSFHATFTNVDPFFSIFDWF